MLGSELALLGRLKAVRLAGGDPVRVHRAMLQAAEHGVTLSFAAIAAVELSGGDPTAWVQEAVEQMTRSCDIRSVA
jgi:uncharacterized protein YqfA (UPF0365 family)